MQPLASKDMRRVVSAKVLVYDICIVAIVCLLTSWTSSLELSAIGGVHFVYVKCRTELAVLGRYLISESCLDTA